MLRRSFSFSALSFLALACGSAPESSHEPTARTEAPIFYGTPATDSKYDAVGALVVEIELEPGFIYYDFICSATLIGPQTMLTARHCTDWIDVAAELGGTAFMVFGQDAFAPDQYVPITSYVNAPPSKNFPGLLLDGGRDAAVAYLESVPEGIVPAKLGHFQEEQIGSEFEIAGFGYVESLETGKKFVGPATARAQSGRWYSLLFNGDKQAYLDWYFTDAATVPTIEEAEVWWDIYRLEPHYEVLAGGLPGESHSCYGDSGGPIFKGTNANDLTVYGVSFAGEASLSTLCTGGGGYLVLNKHMLRWVQGLL
jgi:hypothetical protein